MIVRDCSALMLIVIGGGFCFPQTAQQPIGDQLLSTSLFQLIEFYKQPDPIGLPIGSTLDPMPIPPFKHSIALANMHMQDVQTHGLSKLRVRLFGVNLNEMCLRAQVHMEELVINGTYTLSSLFQSSSGSFRVLLGNAVTSGNVSLIVDYDGFLRTKNIELDFGFEAMSMHFENLGFMGRLFQRLVNSAPNTVTDMIKPFLLQEVNVKIQQEIDGQLAELMEQRGISFANSVPPVDTLIAEARLLLKRKQYDPYFIPDYRNSAGILGVHLSHTWLRGLASFYRSDEIDVTVRNHTAELVLHMSTSRLEGSTQWEVSVIRESFARSGMVQFSVEFVRVELQVQQPLDLRRNPSLIDLQLEIGNIQIHCLGAGTLDYLIEAGVNILPNLLRYQIADAIEGPLKARIREKFECMNMEQFVKQHVADFERRGANFHIDWRMCERKIPEY
ncbi:uncharacterized protein LOC129733760 [Wyeomyia smithii]|uniref:uncharacterized protein LOC129733760 n=1 Tax=Wyeomyia smithii TaxID=174621 RepID=UPI0024680DDC|nr:uncharacterized protein LOC129733760 [Wyeomyia smithii]